MSLGIELAAVADAPSIAALQTRVAETLTRTYGLGHWSAPVTAQSVARAILASTVLVGREAGTIVSTLRLVTKKPWAIDPRYFTPAKRPLHLVSMAVAPALQRNGVGRALLAHAATIARAWPADAIWLDAWDAEAGAGGFYAGCGYREVGRASYRGAALIYYELRL